MIHIRAISENDIQELSGTSYDKMSEHDKLKMIQDSLAQKYEDSYFEIYTVLNDDQVVGFMNIFARSEHIVSISPEIKEEHRNKGFAFEAEKLVLDVERKKNFSAAYASVREDNVASIALHKKLGFEKVAKCNGTEGDPIFIYIKLLDI